MQILIIEDDASIRDMLRECLSDEGYSVLTANDGRQGLELLQASPTVPDLILLDMAMPIMSGWEFLTILQGESRFAPIAVVVLSADNRVVKERSLGEHTSVVAKPVDLDVLLDLVASYDSRR
jgi:CheY-like chemotaxis protein